MARNGLYNMLKTSSATPPASSRSKLATPPDFICHTRCSGKCTACSNVLRRMCACNRLVMRVACQRPAILNVVPIKLTTKILAAIQPSNVVRSPVMLAGRIRSTHCGSGEPMKTLSMASLVAAGGISVSPAPSATVHSVNNMGARCGRNSPRKDLNSCPKVRLRRRLRSDPCHEIATGSSLAFFLRSRRLARYSRYKRRLPRRRDMN